MTNPNIGDWSADEDRVGFIGLGTMGQSIAANLLTGGASLLINDLDRPRGDRLMGGGAAWATTPAEIAARCNVVFTSLPGPAEVDHVALGHNGIIQGAHDGLAYFDLSTNSPTVVRHVHSELSQHGVDVFDAPVSGGVTCCPPSAMKPTTSGRSGPARWPSWSTTAADTLSRPRSPRPSPSASRPGWRPTGCGKPFTTGRMGGAAPSIRWPKTSRSAMRLQEERAGVEVRVSAERLEEIQSS